MTSVAGQHRNDVRWTISSELMLFDPQWAIACACVSDIVYQELLPKGGGSGWVPQPGWVGQKFGTPPPLYGYGVGVGLQLGPPLDL